MSLAQRVSKRQEVATDLPEFRWEDPPPDRRANVKGQRPRQHDWAACLAPLLEHPKRWAHLASWDRSPGGIVGALRRSYPDCEFAQRTDPDAGTHHLYGRYLGDGVAS